VSLTLLRSPQAAHHDPARAEDRPDQPVTDQGSHEFEVCLTPLALDDERVQQTLAWIASPPLVWDVTG
jgi:hypothetical protein